MKTTLLAVTLTALSFIWWPATAQPPRKTGSPEAPSRQSAATSVTVKVGDEAMTFGADAKTQVEARGAGTKTRQIDAAGKPGPHLTDVLTVGQTVAVTYRDDGG